MQDVEKLNTIKSKYAKVFEVEEILNDYFGEDRVDVQYQEAFDIYLRDNREVSVTVLIHFPEVTVTNENNASTVVRDLWVKFYVAKTGTLVSSFTMSRSTFTPAEVYSQYIHSHLPRLYAGMNLSVFKEPCLGTGPIRTTILSLNTFMDSNLWQLFCLELDKYVHTESLAGVPYISLEKIHSRNLCLESEYTGSDILYNKFIFEQHNQILRHFTYYLLDNFPFRFSYVGNRYILGLSKSAFRIQVSNFFIRWYNKNKMYAGDTSSYKSLLQQGILVERVYENTKFYSLGDNQICHDLHNSYVCTFKGQEITVNVIEDKDNNESRALLLLSLQYIEPLIIQIQRFINYDYEQHRIIPKG